MTLYITLHYTTLITFFGRERARHQQIINVSRVLALGCLEPFCWGHVSQDIESDECIKDLGAQDLKSDECVKESGPQDVESDECIQGSGPRT